MNLGLKKGMPKLAPLNKNKIAMISNQNGKALRSHGLIFLTRIYLLKLMPMSAGAVDSPKPAINQTGPVGVPVLKEANKAP